MADINPYVAAGGDIASSIINTTYNAYQANRQREWAEEMMDKQNAWSLEMWNKTNEYNDPKNQVARLTNAGLNPLYYGLDGSSANGLESAQPLGYQRADASIGNPLGAFNDAVIKSAQKDNIIADTENKEQNTRLQAEQAAGTGLDNWFKKQTMAARVEAEYLKNDLTRGEIKQIDKHIEEIEQNIKESIARTDSEVVKQALMKAQERLAKMQANEIAQLMPYRKLLMEAQTEAQKMAAASSFTHSLYEAGLIDAGYIDAMVDEMKANARRANTDADINEIEKAILKWQKDIKSGNYFSAENGNAAHTWLGRRFDGLANNLMEFLSTFGEALGPMANIVSAFVGGKGVGAGVGKAAGKSSTGSKGSSKSGQKTILEEAASDPKAWGLE